MGNRLVLAGGGHAHMMLLASIKDIISQGHKVTVIQPSDYHYYSGMGPGMLSTYYTSDDIRFRTRFVVERQGGSFIKAKVKSIDGQRRVVLLETGEEIPYDVLSCNVGSFVPFNHISGSTENVFSAKPIERLLDAQQKIISLCKKNTISIAVIGGGPAAIEMAGNAYHLATTTGCQSVSVTLFAGNRMMGDYSPGIQRIVRSTFEKYGIEIDETGYIERITDGTIEHASGKQFTPDIIFLATGVKPSAVFEESAIQTGPDGGLQVNAFLQSSQYENIFGGGDCIYFSPQPLAKVGVYAVRENPILRDNVVASLNGSSLTTFNPGGNYLLIFNLGGNRGALQKGPIIFGGNLSFRIKDYIDRKFMREFHALEK